MRASRQRRSVTALVLGVVLMSGCQEATAPVGGCANPAPLEGGADPPAPGYIVVFHADVAPVAETERLAAKYDFTPRHVYEAALKGFAAELSDAALAGVRCEATVDYVEHDGVAQVGFRPDR